MRNGSARHGAGQASYNGEMSTQAILVGISTAIIAGAALSLTMDNYPAAIISGISIGIVAAIAINWEFRRGDRP